MGSSESYRTTPFHPEVHHQFPFNWAHPPFSGTSHSLSIIIYLRIMTHPNQSETSNPNNPGKDRAVVKSYSSQLYNSPFLHLFRGYTGYTLQLPYRHIAIAWEKPRYIPWKISQSNIPFTVPTIYIYTLCIYTHHSIFPLCLYCIDIYIYKHTRSSHRIISPKIPPGGLSSDCHGDILPIIAAVLKITSRNWLMNFIGYEFRITRFFFSSYCGNMTPITN